MAAIQVRSMVLLLMLTLANSIFGRPSSAATASPPLASAKPSLASCNVSRAQSILGGIATGKNFCSSLLHLYGSNCFTTMTTTTTVTPSAASAASASCLTRTKTVAEVFTITSTISFEVTLPQPTSTAYGSTVFIILSSGAVKKRAASIPSSAPRISSTPTSYFASRSTFTASSSLAVSSNLRPASAGIDDETAAARRPPHPDNSTPSALSTCADKSISSACSLLVPRATQTITATTTVGAAGSGDPPPPPYRGRPSECILTTTSTSYITAKRTITTSTTITGTPVIATIITSPSATLTLTVPAACVGTTYEGGQIDPNQFSVVYPDYPDYPIDAVHCCLGCFEKQNCVASYFDTEFGQCELLDRIATAAAALESGTSGSSTKSICPLGTGGFPFTNPGDAILRGPCA